MSRLQAAPGAHLRLRLDGLANVMHDTIHDKPCGYQTFILLNHEEPPRRFR